MSMDNRTTAKEVYEATQVVCSAKLELYRASYGVEDAEKLLADTIAHIAKIDIVLANKYSSADKDTYVQIKEHADRDLISATARKLKHELQLCRSLDTKSVYSKQLAAAELYLARVTAIQAKFNSVKPLGDHNDY